MNFELLSLYWLLFLCSYMYSWLNFTDFSFFNFFSYLDGINFEFTLFETFFSSNLFFIYNAKPSVFSYFDFLFVSNFFLTTPKVILGLYYHFVIELTVYLNFLFFSDFFGLTLLGLQDLVFVSCFMDSSVIFILLDFIFLTSLKYSFATNSFLIYDFFLYSTVLTFWSMTYFFISFIILCLILFFFVSTTKLSYFMNFSMFIRFKVFWQALLIHFRFSQDFVIFVYYFIIFWIFLLLNFDDIYMELVELNHTLLVFIFFAVILFFFYQNGVHFFSYLETSLKERYSSSWLFHQFVRDLSSTFALLLRFGLLIFRLNVYDLLDDFLDSYYIFVCDFDDDFIFEENSLLSSQSIIFMNNLLDNELFYFSEVDFNLNWYSIYFIFLGKLFFSFFFLLELGFRTVLALYIFYLIFLEIHNTLVTLVETK